VTEKIYGLWAQTHPSGVGESGPTNTFTDVALDGQYQYIGDEHMSRAIPLARLRALAAWRFCLCYRAIAKEGGFPMAHGQVSFRSDAREKVLRGSGALADSVRVTFGPKSKCVLIQKRFSLPIVCNDGVTIAKEMELKDAAEYLGTQMIRQAAERTGDAVGDGTSTATILAPRDLRRWCPERCRRRERDRSPEGPLSLYPPKIGWKGSRRTGRLRLMPRRT
jgi:hypothetical protein